MKVTPFDLSVLLVVSTAGPVEHRELGNHSRAARHPRRSQLSGSRNRLLLTAGDRCLGHIGDGKNERGSDVAATVISSRDG
jgi:hypothetical protein